MLTSSTTRFHDLAGHLDFEVEYDSDVALAIDVDWLLKYLTEQVEKGIRYEPGQLIQIGWMMNRIEKKEKMLTLTEPDFEEFPIRFTRGVTNTLRDLRLQKSMAESVGLVHLLDFPTILHSAIACLRHEDCAGFVMERARPENQDSGWFIGCNDPSHNHNNPSNLRRASLYELALTKPAFVPFLGLPPCSRVDGDGRGKIEIRFKNEPIAIRKDSLLAEYLKQISRR